MAERKTPVDGLHHPLGTEALKAFAHPLRIAMYRWLSAHGSGTASQVARALGESTGQTSYHLRQLERHGLIEDDPNAPTGGRERWWRPIGFSLDSRHLEDPASRLAAETALRAVIEERAETLQAWFASIESAAPWDESALHTASSSDLTLDEAAELGRELQEVLDRHTDAAKARKDAGERDGRRRVRVYLDVFPLPVDD
ncbi:helix-turn-helix domain-containing protein [Cellulomonas sp. DKR-3]|uniref:Helix-turn-helix domain-containing protein n=1 Tax=Cellulomonas fulva TaxID=2835530 RepID=A0ABS5TY22_9CELL|nr:helix-turn-helix domain-containing protein [Cellulomonas fulva]MBT0994010.1 helix-turn-helix domain-containing protein [Cellulomonas fulva]